MSNSFVFHNCTINAVIPISMSPSALVIICHSKFLHRISRHIHSSHAADGNPITMPPSNVHPQVNIREKKGYSAKINAKEAGCEEPGRKVRRKV
jgi:hypothetical protein